jgi:hypothetical protein
MRGPRSRVKRFEEKERWPEGISFGWPSDEADVELVRVDVRLSSVYTGERSSDSDVR